MRKREIQYNKNTITIIIIISKNTSTMFPQNIAKDYKQEMNKTYRDK